MEMSMDGNPTRIRLVPIPSSSVSNTADSASSNPTIKVGARAGSPASSVLKEGSITSEGSPQIVAAHVAANNNGNVKRRRTNDVQNESNTNRGTHAHKKAKKSSNSSFPIPKSPTVLSVQTLLSLPLSFLFRQTKSTNPRAPDTNHTISTSTSLLSRLEASILLQISNIAHELDHLHNKTIEALHHSRLAQTVSFSLTSSSNVSVNPYTRSLHPYLQMRGVTLPQKVLQYSQINVERILEDLKAMSISLKQCCEQNFSVADALLDTICDDGDGIGSEEGTVGKLAREKSQLAELEEEMCRRIEGLIKMGRELNDGEEENDGSGGYTDVFDQAVDEHCNFISMAQLCESMFPTEKAIVMVSGTSSLAPIVDVDERMKSVPREKSSTMQNCEGGLKSDEVVDQEQVTKASSSSSPSVPREDSNELQNCEAAFKSNEAGDQEQVTKSSSSSCPRESVQVTKSSHESLSEAAEALGMLGRVTNNSV